MAFWNSPSKEVHNTYNHQQKRMLTNKNVCGTTIIMWSSTPTMGGMKPPWTDLKDSLSSVVQ